MTKAGLRGLVLVLMVAGASFVAIAGDVLAQAGTGTGSEKGAGQTESTLERSGGEQNRHSMGMAQVPAGIGEKGTGQTQSTLERSGSGQSRSSQGSAEVPAGIGEKGTGQTESTLERSGGDKSRVPEGIASVPTGE